MTIRLELTTTQKANLRMLGKVGSHLPDRLDEIADVFHTDFVFTYVNPKQPGIHGEYRGAVEFANLFARLSEYSNGTFQGRFVQSWPIGDELVVVQSSPSMTIGDSALSTDAAVVWRIVDGQLHSAWDIPAIYGGLRGAE